MTSDEDRFGVDLEARVEQAFAPDPAALARIRAQVGAEFRASATEPSRGRARWSLRLRPAAAFLFASALLAASFGVVAANSGAGQPFYGLRLAAEELTLPASGEARLQAQLARLDQRLADAQRGAAAGDPGAVAAALAAYRAELADTVTTADAQGGDLDAILAALAKHQGVLEALAGSVPAAAAPGIDQALDQVDRAADAHRTPQPTPAHPTPAPGGGPPSGVPGATHKPSSPPGAP